MPNPILRDRLAKIIKTAARQYPFGSDIDEGCRGIADALRASEEWRAREAVVKAAMLRSELAARKVLHILTCAACERLEVDDGRWCNEATAMSRKTLDAIAAEDAALARLATVRKTT